MILAAFDPGSKSGALAMVSIEMHAWRRVEDLPTMGAGKQVILNGAELAGTLRAAGVTHAVVEHVHSMPRQGVASMFRFGCAFGQILGVLQALGIPYELVQPQTWKRAMRLPGGEGKQEIARNRALELFPTLHDRLARKKDHNRAEALLLAQWYLDNRAGRAR